MEGPGDSTADFNRRYSIGGEAVMRRIERRVIGCDYGATSYTTQAQADRLTQMLRLQRGQHLLDIGSGSGWAGIYLAASTGCRVTLTDLPLEGLRAAGRRMRSESPGGSVVAASGVSLPFRDGVFDAATSSDVFC